MGQARSTQRYRLREAPDQRRLVKALHELSSRHPRYGYRRVTVLLRADGWRVNAKRVQRLWRREGLRVPHRRHKRRRLGHAANSCVRRRPEHRNHVWGVDFTSDSTSAGRRLRILSVIDEYTRYCVRLEPAHHMVGGEVRELLRRSMREWGTPHHIRCDNGPEWIAKVVRRALEELGVETLYIEPGSPWQNGYVESFHARLKDELINGELYGSLAEARVSLADWRDEYNHRRPHGSIGNRTPADFAAQCASAGSAPLRRPKTRNKDQTLSGPVRN
jgi:transposase InsO family protein